jgi:hypothetical protein
MNTTLGLTSLLLVSLVVVVIAARNRVFAGPLLVGLASRVTLAIVDALVFELPGHSDSSHYDVFAFYQARNGVIGTFEFIATGSDLYTWLVSFFYALFERSSLMMQGLNVLFGTLIVLNVGRISEHLGGSERLARRAAWLAALFPSLNYFSAVLLREVAVAYPLSLGVLYLAYWYRSRRWQHMLVAVVALLVSMAFHSGSLAVLLAAGVWLVGAWVRSLFAHGFRHLGRNTLALVAGSAAIVFVFVSGFGLSKFKAIESAEVGGLTQTQSDYARGRTAYLEDLHPESPTEVVLQTPIRLTYFLFAPFPWMLRAGSDVLGVVDSFFFFFLFFRVWRQRSLVASRRESVLVLAVFGAMALTFAMAVSNYGTALRHRNKMLPLLIGVALSVPWKRVQRAASRPGSSAVPALQGDQ